MDALKSSAEATNCQQQLSWVRLYKKVRHLDSVSCHKLSEPDAGMVLPKPRASHSLNFVSDCLVLFGGGCEGGIVLVPSHISGFCPVFMLLSWILVLGLYCGISLVTLEFPNSYSAFCMIV